jgi:hypothetical protein
LPREGALLVASSAATLVETLEGWILASLLHILSRPLAFAFALARVLGPALRLPKRSKQWADGGEVVPCHEDEDTRAGCELQLNAARLNMRAQKEAKATKRMLTGYKLFPLL